METNTAIDKIAQEMLEANIVLNDSEPLRMYLGMIMSIGYNNGLKVSGGNRPVSQYDKNGNYLASFVSSASAGKLTGIYKSGINDCCRGKLKSAGGYVWKFTKKWGYKTN